MAITNAQRKLLIGIIVIVLCLVIAATLSICLVVLNRTSDQSTTLVPGINSSTNHTNDDQSSSTEPTTAAVTTTAATTTTKITTTTATTTTTAITTTQTTTAAITTATTTKPTMKTTIKITTETTSFFTSTVTKPDATTQTTSGTRTTTNSSSTTDVTSIRNTANIISTADITSTANIVKMGTTMSETTNKNENIATSATATSSATSYMFIDANSTVKSITYTMTTQQSMVSLLKPTDPIVALCNTVPGGNSYKSPTNVGWQACQSPSSGELVTAILDGNLETKHVTFGNAGASVMSAAKGVDTGFYVVPQGGIFSVLQAFQFGTANDFPERDPLTITIEASQFSTSTYLEMGSSWNLIYNGSTGINRSNDSDRSAYGSMQTITHPSPYKAYRILIAEKRGVENSVQYSEVQFFGYFTN